MIFPDWGTAPDTAPEEALPLFREWAVDWENESFALRRGEPYLVSGDEALKIWVTRALRPESQPLYRMVGGLRQRADAVAGRLRGSGHSGKSGAAVCAGRAAGVSLYPGGGRVLLFEEGEPGGGPVHRAHRL